MAEGEMVTLILVTGSVQVDDELLAAVVEVLLEHVTAVLAGAAPQEAMPNTARSNAKSARSFTEAPSSLFEIADGFDCVSAPFPRMKIYVQFLHRPDRR